MKTEALRRALEARPREDLHLRALEPGEALPGGFVRAAVLVPLLECEGEAHVLLTRRRGDLRRHAGQVSFPGGRIEPGEDSLSAALRESQEEIGLDPTRVDVLGRLDDTLVLATGFRLTPWVGLVPYPYPYMGHPGEVEEILYVPLAALSSPGVHRTEELAGREAYGELRLVHFYDLPSPRSQGGGGSGANPLTIWGATARILDRFLGVWTSL
jgi:8-oxo-dGTP pyrophosphatase MutT (NUDIX family)